MPALPRHAASSRPAGSLDDPPEALAAWQLLGLAWLLVRPAEKDPLIVDRYCPYRVGKYPR